MLQLTLQTEKIAHRVAARVGRKPEEVTRTVLEREAEALGATEERAAKRRMTAVEMLALGREIAAPPVLDPRSPKEITDDLKKLWWSLSRQPSSRSSIAKWMRPPSPTRSRRPNAL